MNKPLLFWALTAGLLVLATNSISADDATKPADETNPADVVETVFEPPVRLMADGEVIDTGEAWGHSSPCVADLDGDGLDDLILGDFSGKTLYYLCQSHGHVWVYLRKPSGPGEPVAVKFESSKQTIQPGDSVKITANFKIAPGYEIHVFEAMPLATATRLKLALPPGFSQAKTWEEPPMGPSLYPGRGTAYHGNVTFYQEVSVVDDIAPGDYELTCSVAYQACDSKQCLRPVESAHKITVTVKP